jgi:AcrR family transcriptional regulator
MRAKKPEQAGSGSRARAPLSRERVLRAAVKVADEGGIESVTMRRLADELGAEAMSLYYHVSKKEEILDGLVEIIVREINDAVGQLGPASADGEWKAAARQRILTARKVFLRHPWAPGVFGSRAVTSPEVLRYFDALVGLMRDGGFSYDLVHHALHALGSRALGFSQELLEPDGDTSDGPAPAMPEDMALLFPHLAGMLAEVAHDDPDSTLGWCDDQFEFEFGLDLILDGLDAMRQREKEKGNKEA